MSSSDRRNEGESAGRRLIREVKEEAWHARCAVRREMPTPSAGAKRELTVALADYRDLLSDYANERALEKAWDERDVDVDSLRHLLTKTTTISESVPRRGNAKKTVTVQLAATVDASVLIQIGKELDAIAKELDFAPQAKDPTPSEEADMSDLRGLMKARGQEEALEFLPEDDAGGGEE